MNEITWDNEKTGYNAPRIAITNFYNEQDETQNHAVWKRGGVTIKVGDYKGNWKDKNSAFTYIFDFNDGIGECYISDHETTFSGNDSDFNILEKPCYKEGKYIVNGKEYFAAEGKLKESDAFTDLRYKLNNSFTDEVITVSKEIVIPKLDKLQINEGVTLKFEKDGKLIFKEGATLWIYGTLITSADFKELDLTDPLLSSNYTPLIRIMGDHTSTGKIIVGSTIIELTMDGKDPHEESEETPGPRVSWLRGLRPGQAA